MLFFTTLRFHVFTTHTKPSNAFPLPIVKYGRLEAVTSSQYLHRQVNSNKHSSLLTSSHPQQTPIMGQGETPDKFIILCPLTNRTVTL